MVVLALIPESGRERQADLCEFEASLVYRASSRLFRAKQGVSGSTEQGNYNSGISVGIGQRLRTHLEKLLPFLVELVHKMEVALSL